MKTTQYFGRQNIHLARVAKYSLILAILPALVASINLSARELDEVQVIGITPLHGSASTFEQYPANVQILNQEDIKRGGLDLTDTINRQLGSVNINAAQNNPLQPDVQYRGFTASPLLGLPQGLAVYRDGVRQNATFGDTVHWDTIPQIAIDSINLMPGSNPLFGLNTLGGALSVSTKNGFNMEDSRAVLSAGSFKRRETELETGGNLDHLAYYLALRHFDEDGWRDYSPSEATNIFGKLSWRHDKGSFDLSLNHDDSDLIGNGAAPIQLLDQDRDAIFTRPDQTENNLLGVILNADMELNDNMIGSGNIYFRRHDIDTLNGDDSDFEDCALPINAGLLCEDEGGGEEIVEDANGNDVSADNALEGGTINTSKTEQDTYGLAGQLDIFGSLGGKSNQLTLGASWDEGKAHYTAQTELGSLDATRFAVGGGVIVGESLVDVKTTSRNFSLYFTDTLSLTERLSLNVAGRWNRTSIELRDQRGTALNGDHKFIRFNPSLGLTHTSESGTNIYGSYSEATRAPTPSELTCADPNDPCRLPNAFVADPPLEQVVAKTLELGARGTTKGVNWQVAAFTTTNHEDIIFISSGALSSQGYFDNIGDTRRRGIELGLSGKTSYGLDWTLAYTYLDATFQNRFTAPSANHPNAVGGEITVNNGDRIPGIPKHMLKFSADYSITDSLTIGGDLIANSEQYMRGDESNQLDPVDSFGVINLRGTYEIKSNLKLFAKIDNVTDKEYETFGVLGEADEVLGASFNDNRFMGPAQPRAGWIGLEYTF